MTSTVDWKSPNLGYLIQPLNTINLIYYTHTSIRRYVLSICTLTRVQHTKSDLHAAHEGLTRVQHAMSNSCVALKV